MTKTNFNTETFNTRLKAVFQRLIDQHNIQKGQKGVWDGRVQSNVVRWVPIDQKTLCLQLEEGNCNDFTGLMEVACVMLPDVDLILVVNDYDPPWLYLKNGDHWVFGELR